MMHLLGALAVAWGEEQSKGCGGEDRANCGDIREAGPLTPKVAVGSVAKELATLPRVVTTLRSKGKGKGKAREEEEDEEEQLEEQIEETFTDKQLVKWLHWKKALMVVDMGMGAGVVLKKTKGKLTVLLEK
ncbi:hypothetical protein C0989_011940 [Termitomyces sp. Mn162]|nr:hypothetical protein C0989_011940 [Termitomyces sp. Mn162]